MADDEAYHSQTIAPGDWANLLESFW